MSLSKNKATGYEHAIEEVANLIHARVPIIWVRTHEEVRFIDDFSENAAEKLKRQLMVWSGYQGLVKPKEFKKAERASGQFAESWVPQKALDQILKMPVNDQNPGYVYILRDFHAVLQEPVIRMLRDMYDFLADNGKSLIIVSPVLGYGVDGKNPGLPPALEKQVVVVDYALPNRDQIDNNVGKILEFIKNNNPNSKTKLDYTADEMLAISRALQGLTLTEIENSVAACLSHLKKLDVEHLLQDKKQIVRKNQILEFIDTDVEAKDIGGLDVAKTYLERYSKAYTKEAVEFGVEPLKGALFTGIPGTGKSQIAKAMGHIWKVPLLRLDVGKVMNGLVGGSEQRMREVIATAEAMAPCVLWIDEVEKSLSGTGSSNFSDGGTLSRVFGTLLTAMQEGMDGVTIIATANDISKLPPEFIRRFNEVFFVDLPSIEERWEILSIHLTRRNWAVKDFEKAKAELMEASENFTGAELEKAVKDGIARAFYAGDKTLKPVHIVESMKETKPIFKIYATKVKEMQEWAAGHARYASSYSEKKAKANQAKLKANKADLDKVTEGLADVGKKTKPAVNAGDNAGRFAEVE